MMKSKESKEVEFDPTVTQTTRRGRKKTSIPKNEEEFPLKDDTVDGKTYRTQQAKNRRERKKEVMKNLQEWDFTTWFNELYERGSKIDGNSLLYGYHSKPRCIFFPESCTERLPKLPFYATFPKTEDEQRQVRQRVDKILFKHYSEEHDYAGMAKINKLQVEEEEEEEERARLRQMAAHWTQGGERVSRLAYGGPSGFSR